MHYRQLFFVVEANDIDAMMPGDDDKHAEQVVSVSQEIRQLLAILQLHVASQLKRIERCLFSMHLVPIVARNSTILCSVVET